MGSSISILYDNIASLAVASLVLLIVWFMQSNTTTIMPEEDNETKLEVNDRLQNMNSTADQEDRDISICANCGKKGDDNSMNMCNKCEQVKYCNAACKKKHRHKHKKDCERLIAQLHDEKLFKQPPPEEDCPICFIRLPTLICTGSRYFTCCGKTVCSGCVYAPVYDDQGNIVDDKKCPFCRAPSPETVEGSIDRLKKRVELNDPKALLNHGIYYEKGLDGYPKDQDKAFELYHRAGELGYARAYSSIGYAYSYGIGVRVDNEKAVYYYELSAMGGSAEARCNLGLLEFKTGNMERAMKHLMIAVKSGQSTALKQIKKMYSNGHATKEDYTKALRSYQAYLGEIKSRQRDVAAAAHDDLIYYESGV